MTPWTLSSGRGMARASAWTTWTLRSTPAIFWRKTSSMAASASRAMYRYPRAMRGRAMRPVPTPSSRNTGSSPFGCTAEAMAVAIWPATSGGWALSLS